jgi:hypothetical protein
MSRLPGAPPERSTRRYRERIRDVHMDLQGLAMSLPAGQRRGIATQIVALLAQAQGLCEQHPWIDAEPTAIEGAPALAR